MALIAKKPCSFGGKAFFIGEEVPDELVMDAEYQEQLGVISRIAKSLMDDMNKPKEPLFSIPIFGADETFGIMLSEKQVQEVVTILQMDTEKAIEAIGKIEEENVLIVAHACDLRSEVKNAAKQRAEALTNNLPTEETTTAQTGEESPTTGEESPTTGKESPTTGTTTKSNTRRGKKQ